MRCASWVLERMTLFLSCRPMVWGVLNTTNIPSRCKLHSAPAEVCPGYR
jgi:hypothetical protein